MKKLIEAVQKAKQDTARVMTAQLRQSALEHGWEPGIVGKIRVDHSGENFSVKVHSSVADKAFTHEYGNENVRPTAAARKLLNDPKHFDTAFMARLNHHWGK